MPDLSNLKIPVFTGINDTPVAPIATKAGNGSHLISKFNSLVETVEQIPTSNSTSKWKTKNPTTENNLAVDGDKLLVIASGEIRLPVPTAVGNMVEFLTYPDLTAYILPLGNMVNNQEIYACELNTPFEVLGFIWDGYSWITTRNGIFNLNTQFPA